LFGESLGESRRRYRKYNKGESGEASKDGISKFLLLNIFLSLYNLFKGEGRRRKKHHRNGESESSSFGKRRSGESDGEGESRHHKGESESSSFGKRRSGESIGEGESRYRNGESESSSFGKRRSGESIGEGESRGESRLRNKKSNRQTESGESGKKLINKFILSYIKKICLKEKVDVNNDDIVSEKLHFLQLVKVILHQVKGRVVNLKSMVKEKIV